MRCIPAAFAASFPVAFGDGFVIQGDALNLGEGLDGIVDGFSANRGGAYWLAARKVFSNTILLSAGGEVGPRGDVFYLASDNPAQASTEIAGVNLEYNSEVGTFGFLYVSGLGVDEDEAAFLGLL